MLRRRRDVAPASFRAPAGLALAFASIVLCVALAASSTAREAATTAVAALIGLAVYFAYRVSAARGLAR